MLLDVAVARQVLSFFFLTFVPGIVVLKLLKLKDLGAAETGILSVGLSIAFLMFIGLSLNELGPIVGVSEPLSEWPLMTIVGVAVLLMCLVGCVTGKEDFFLSFTVSEGSRLSRIGPFVLLPFLSIAGSLLVSVSQNNVLLLLMIVLISILMGLSALSSKLFPSRFHSLALLMIAIALLLHATLISNYIYGYDVNIEYYIFRLTENNSRWNSTISAYVPEYDKINGMLSLTVLPTIYARTLNLPATWILKLVYPMLFSFVPLCLYQLYKVQLGREKVAFASAFFFMATSAFFTEMLGLTRQMIAELFFVLLFFVLWTDKVNPPRKKMFLFIIFGAALAVSHYSLSYIFMFYISLTWLSMYVLRRRTARITASMVVMLSVMLFSWYIYVSASAPFNGLVNMGDHVLTSISTEFFNPESRGQEVLRGLGMESAPSSWNLLGRVFAYATEFLIIIGFTALVARRKKKALDLEHFAALSISMIILASCIALPGVAGGLRMTRYYHTVLIFLSPLCILGGEVLLGFLARGRIKTESCTAVLVLIVLIPYFLFQTGFVYEVTGVSSWSIPLSKYRMGLTLYTMGYIDAEDAVGAIWLSERMNPQRASLYADDMARNSVLSSYGMTRRDHVVNLSNNTVIQANDTIFLRMMNLVYGVLLAQRWSVESAWNLTEISPVIGNMSKVYSNGGCEIYRAMSNQTAHP